MNKKRLNLRSVAKMTVACLAVLKQSTLLAGAIAISAMLMFTSCNQDDKTNVDPSEPIALAGTKWIIYSDIYNDVTISFNANNTCSSINDAFPGTWSQTGNDVTFELDRGSNAIIFSKYTFSGTLTSPTAMSGTITFTDYYHEFPEITLITYSANFRAIKMK